MEVEAQYIEHCVSVALAEDVGSGDITASLIAADATARAHVVAREDAVVCGRAWVDEVFRQLGNVDIRWHFEDGESVREDESICDLSGNTRSLLSGERCALNFLQLLCGTATAAKRYADAVRGTGCTILDTRKTLPGLRLAQKYAVRCGGGANHRFGLFDAFLIKENHLAAAENIAGVIRRARELHPQRLLEIEVEDLEQLEQACDAGADRIMLDNFNLQDLARAVQINAGRAALEASGNVTHATLAAVAATGVDFVSIGALTKDVRAIDLSMRFV